MDAGNVRRGKQRVGRRGGGAFYLRTAVVGGRKSAIAILSPANRNTEYYERTKTRVPFFSSSSSTQQLCCEICKLFHAGDRLLKVKYLLNWFK